MAKQSQQSIDFTTARRVMVESQLRPSAVNDPVVIGAMAVTAREAFIPEAKEALAYIDRAIPLGNGRVINPPVVQGLLLGRADLRASDNLLVIGSACGYLPALASKIVTKVTALEEDEQLHRLAQQALQGYGNVEAINGALNRGAAANGPYDLIIIEGAVELIPDAIINQLSDGGRLLAGQLENGVTRLAMGRKTGSNFALFSFADNDIAPLAQFAAPKEYRF